MYRPLRQPLRTLVLLSLVSLVYGCPPPDSDPPDVGGDTTTAPDSDMPTDTPVEAETGPGSDASPPDADTEDGGELEGTIADYIPCSIDPDCPVGTGSCVTSVPLNRPDADGTDLVPIPEIFPELDSDGVCGATCTNGADRCSDPTLTAATPGGVSHTCQIVVTGQAPYPTDPPAFPFDDQIDPSEMAKAQPFGALCRPPLRLDAAVDDAFCQSCQAPEGCETDAALCWNPATNAAAADGESGTCLAPCAADSDCPLGFSCDVTDPSGQSYCRPRFDTCTNCRDIDGDGRGTGRCGEGSPGAISAYDCDDYNPDAYYDPQALEHPFPMFCGDHDYNCNGLSDRAEQVGASSYPEEHCSACQATCAGSVPDGQKTCHSLNDGGAACQAECADGPDEDSLQDYADCDGNLANGCEVPVDDPSRIYYRDADGDGYGNPKDAKFNCDTSSAPDGYVSNADDCEMDNSPKVYGGANPAPEICDGLDNDCDGDVDEADSDLTKAGTNCLSNEPGVCQAGTWSCQGAMGWACNPDIQPGTNEEKCGDTLDNDCDGQTDEMWDPMEPDPTMSLGYTTVYRDCDGDGWGSDGPAAATCPNSTAMGPGKRFVCGSAAGFAPKKGDCDDANPAANPGRDERCSTNFDDDCDMQVNEDDAADVPTWYVDRDGDMQGANPADHPIAPAPVTACTKPTSQGGQWAANSNDCDDTSAKVHPGKQETCEPPTSTQIDNDCSGSPHNAPSWQTQTYYRDEDRDGYGTSRRRTLCPNGANPYTATQLGDCNDTPSSGVNQNPGVSEKCNGIDDNCAGGIDEQCPNDRHYADVANTTTQKPFIGPRVKVGSINDTTTCPSGDGVWSSVSVSYKKNDWPIREIDIGCERYQQVESAMASPLYTYSLSQEKLFSRAGINWYDSTASHIADGVGTDKHSANYDRGFFECSHGESIYKVEITYGTEFDRIKFTCRPYNIKQARGTDYTISGLTDGDSASFGGSGGTNTKRQKCDADEVAIGLGVYRNPNQHREPLNSIKLLCADVTPDTDP